MDWIASDQERRRNKKFHLLTACVLITVVCLCLTLGIILFLTWNHKLPEVTATNTTRATKTTEGETTTLRARGTSYLTEDELNFYYKVPIPWGIKLYNGIVSVVCRSADMKPVCHRSGQRDPSHSNVDGCLKMKVKARYDYAMVNIAELLNDCDGTYAGVYKCRPLYDLFNALNSFDAGECGVNATNYCTSGNDYRSSVNHVSNTESQFFGLYGLPKDPPSA